MSRFTKEEFWLFMARQPRAFAWHDVTETRKLSPSMTQCSPSRRRPDELCNVVFFVPNASQLPHVRKGEELLVHHSSLAPGAAECAPPFTPVTVIEYGSTLFTIQSMRDQVVSESLTLRIWPHTVFFMHNKYEEENALMRCALSRAQVVEAFADVFQSDQLLPIVAEYLGLPASRKRKSVD